MRVHADFVGAAVISQPPTRSGGRGKANAVPRMERARFGGIATIFARQPSARLHVPSYMLNYPLLILDMPSYVTAGPYEALQPPAPGHLA